MKPKSILFFLSVFISIVGYAQSGKLFSVDVELSSSIINSVYQDRNGIIWIATEDGLNRYDGSKFTIYKNDKHNPNSLLHNYTRILFEDSKGHFFIGLLNGLQIYDYAEDSFTEVPLILESGDKFNAHVFSILERQNGDILIGTSGQGLFILKKENNKYYAKQIKDLIPSTTINVLFEDKDQNLWVSTQDKGLIRLDNNKQMKIFSHFKERVGNTVSSICQDKDGNLYVGSMGKGLYIHDRDSDSFTSIPYQGNPDLPIKTLFLNSRNKIYIGTDGDGMKIYDPESKKIIDGNFKVTTFDFTKSKIHSIIEDKSGNLWLGIFQKGVMLLPAQTNKFNYIGYKSINQNIIGSNCIMSVFEDHEGTLWVGTDIDGIYGISADGDQKVHFRHTKEANSVPSTIMSIYEDSDHNLWLGSYLNGLAQMDKRTGKCNYSCSLIDNNLNYEQHIYCFAEDKEKNLWIGTMGSGIFCLNLITKEIKHYTIFEKMNYRVDVNMLHNNWVSSMLISSNGKLYIGTYDGLGCMDLKTRNFSSTYGKNRLKEGLIVYNIFEDSEGTIWFGTSEGLMHIADSTTGKVDAYTMENGLPSNIICGIIEDKNKNLWISTNYGISKMNLQDRSFINYYSNDGLQGNEFSKNVALMNRKGEIVFGGISGITYFKPEEITNSVKQLNVFITDFYIHDKAVKKGMQSGSYSIIDTSVINARKFNLAHNDNSFTIEFSTMDFNHPERITYMYSMNDNNWISLRSGTSRVTFNNLAPGEYNFKVKALDYNIESEIKEITIVIHPVWYFSIWVKLIYILIAVIIIYIIVQQIRQRNDARQKIREQTQAKEINEAKLQFFINISHEIRTPISLILNPLKKLVSTDKDKDHQKVYAMMSRNAERILLLINQLMDIRKIDKGQMSLKFQKIEIVNFMNYLCSFFEDQVETKNIELELHPDVDELEVWIDPKNFDKVILNILSNALKYTPEGGKIDVFLHIENNPNTVEKSYYEIIIADNGVGIDESEVERIFERFYQAKNSLSSSVEGTGIGLHLAQSLIELHHGTIKAENNKDGKGSRFTIRLPLGKEHLGASEVVENSTIEYKYQYASQPLPVLAIEEDEVKIKAKSKHRILVVDDDAEIRNYISQELASDYRIVESVNGKEALSIVYKRMPDLIISDVMMPEIDGITLCRKIRQNVNTNHIPVILLTAKSKEEDNVEGLNIGADAYLVKPFSLDILKKTVQSIIRNREILKNSYSGNQLQKDKIQKVTMKSTDERLLERIMIIINKNIANSDLNVEMLASQIGISRVHLHRKLKELTNQSTRDLIRNIRLQQAAELLSTKHLVVSDVAIAMGFTNISYFSNAFKELYGMSPSAYMEMHLNKRSEEV